MTTQHDLFFLKYVKPERQAQFRSYFANCPAWLFQAMEIEKVKSGTSFVKEGMRADMVYFALDGLIKVTDYRVHGNLFDYMLFTDVSSYGGMECLMGLECYLATLQAVTDCVLLKLSRAVFKRWMETDIQAVTYEAKLTMEYLYEQNQNNRAFLFLQGADRLAYFFVKRYEKYAVDGIFQLEGNRQGLADFTGMCLKTITRSIKKLSEADFITKDGKYIVINQEQYERMKAMVANILVDNS